MAYYQTCWIVLHTAFLCTAQTILTLLPEDPVVSVGGTIQLNCSISCPNGSTTWKGLDTNLAGQSSHPGYSLLTIENARISMEGSRICVGSCPGFKKNFQRSVILQVYALPQSLQLTSHMEQQPPSLRCSMYGVYSDSSISLSWYRGLEKLEVDSNNEEVSDENEGLFTLTWTLDMTEMEIWATYRCEAQLDIGGHVFRREGVLELENQAASSSDATPSTTPEITQTTSAAFERPRITSSLPFSVWRTKTTLGIQRNPTPSTESPDGLDTLKKDNITQRQPNATALVGKKHGTDLVTQSGQRKTWLSASIICIESGKSLKSNRPSELNTNHIIYEILSTTVNPTALTPVFQGTSLNIDVNDKPSIPTRSISHGAEEERTTTIPRTRSPGMAMSSATKITGTTPTILRRSLIASTTTSVWDTAMYEAKASHNTPATESTTQRPPHTPTPTENRHVTEPITHRDLWKTRLPHTFTSIKSRSPTTHSVTSNPVAQTTSTTTRFVASTAERVPTTATPTKNLELLWMGFSSLGMAGSILLSLQLWRRLNRKGSFQLKQP